MSAGPAPRAREIPVNTANPTPLVLGEVIAHLARSRFFRLLLHPAPLISIIGLLLAGALFEPDLVLAALVGIAVALLLVVSIYLVWYGNFTVRNARLGNLCPHCLSRIWQVCCARCHEPVPPLALLWRGAFLAECPHCDLHLSCSDETLLAWCSTCLYTIERPDRFYRKASCVVVWAVPHASGAIRICVPWLLVRNRGSVMTLFHPGDSHSSTILLIADGRETPNFEPHVIESTSTRLVSRRLSQSYANQYRAVFSKALEREMP